MPLAVMAPMYAAAIAGGAQTASSVASSRAQAGASRRATAAQTQAATRAEAFEREQDGKDRADEARIEAEEHRRWDADQANKARQQAQDDARLQMMDRRQQYEDSLRHGKRVRLAELTGGPVPQAPPMFGAPADGTYTPLASTYAAPGAPVMSRQGTANAMIAAPGQFDPFAEAQAPWMMPLSDVSRRRVS